MSREFEMTAKFEGVEGPVSVEISPSDGYGFSIRIESCQGKTMLWAEDFDRVVAEVEAYRRKDAA